MSDVSPADGICQDINAYGITTGVSPPHIEAEAHLAGDKSQLPLAFQKIDPSDRIKIVSPYATGFAAEALFERGNGPEAVHLIEGFGESWRMNRIPIIREVIGKL